MVSAGERALVTKPIKNKPDQSWKRDQFVDHGIYWFDIAKEKINTDL